MSASVRLSMFVIPALGGFTCAPSLGAQVNTPEEVKLLEVWNTEGKEIADGLTTIHGLAEAEDGRIWISDVWPTQGRVLRLDPETMNAEVVGRTGEGPGEVRLPTYMAVTPDGRMAVYDMARSAVEIYDSDGEPFRRVQLRGAPVPAIKGFAALATGGYVVSGFSPPVASAIHYFDDEGRWVRGWRERYPPRHAFPSGESELTVMMAQTAGTGGTVHALPDGSFLYSQAAPHDIVLFEVSSTPGSGWVERLVASMPHVFEPPGVTVVEKTTEGGQTFTGYREAWPHSMRVFELGNGYVLNIVDMGEEERWLWQVFDRQRATDGMGAALIAEAVLDRRYSPKFLCENGDILASARDPDTGVSHVVRLRLDAPWLTARQRADPRRGSR